MNKKMYVLTAIYLFSECSKYAICAASVLLENAYNCPDAQNPMPLVMDVVVVKTFRNNTQAIKIHFSIPFAVHTNTLAIAKIEYNPLGSSWVSLLKIEDKKGMCNLFTLNGGEIWIQTQKAVGMPQNTCAIPKGNYRTNHFLLNLTKLKIASVPAGNYRVTMEVFEKANNRLLLCKMFNIQDKS